MPIHDALPEWDKREHHHVSTSASAGQVLKAIDELRWGEVLVFRALMSVRFHAGDRFPPEEPVVGWFHDAGFAELERGPDGLVLGLLYPVGRGSTPIRANDLHGFQQFCGSTHLKIALGFRVAAGRLDTETRILAPDSRARRRFAVYWAAIRPFSGLIRREWLRAIRRRAERTQVPP